jgi:hypothetical protein
MRVVPPKQASASSTDPVSQFTNLGHRDAGHKAVVARSGAHLGAATASRNRRLGKHKSGSNGALDDDRRSRRVAAVRARISRSRCRTTAATLPFACAHGLPVRLRSRRSPKARRAQRHAEFAICLRRAGRRRRRCGLLGRSTAGARNCRDVAQALASRGSPGARNRSSDAALADARLWAGPAVRCRVRPLLLRWPGCDPSRLLRPRVRI